MKKIAIILLSFNFVFLQEFDEKLFICGEKKTEKKIVKRISSSWLIIGLKTILILSLS